MLPEHARSCQRCTVVMPLLVVQLGRAREPNRFLSAYRHIHLAARHALLRHATLHARLILARDAFEWRL